MKNIILTIDTEGPRGSDPVLYQIWGKVGNEYYGIPKIIEICNRYGIKGLFFVDIPEIWDMGYDKIKDVINYIREKGHDVGVHIHPHHMPNASRHFLFDYSKEEQYKIINECTKKYIEITGEKPVSFRAGKYGANRDTLDILSELGYVYDFSEFYSQKWCGIKPEIDYVLPVKYKSIIEFPVTIFKSVSIPGVYHRYDKLEATNYPEETIHILEQYAKTKNEELIVLFLHSFSFLNYLDTPDAPTLNKDNLNRFEQTIEGIVNLKSYRFIGERELAAVNTVTKDGIDNIVKTKGWYRQFKYFYNRANGIRATNKKAKVFIGLVTVMKVLIGLLLLFVLFVIGRGIL